MHLYDTILSMVIGHINPLKLFYFHRNLDFIIKSFSKSSVEGKKHNPNSQSSQYSVLNIYFLMEYNMAFKQEIIGGMLDLKWLNSSSN